MNLYNSIMPPTSRRALASFAAVLLFACVCSAAPPGRGQITKAEVNYSGLRVGGDATLVVAVEIQPGFHAQSHTPLDPNYIKFELKPANNDSITFGTPQYPAGKVEDFPALGKLSVYTGEVVVYVPVHVKADAKPGPIEITGKLRYQVCDDNACYPPESPAFKVSTQVVPADAKVTATETIPAPPATQPVTQPAAATPGSSSPAAPMNVVSGESAPKSAAYQFLLAFLAGVIFNVVPCVLPVLPLKAIGFYEASQHSRLKSVSFGAAFSLGLIATFAAFGVLIFGYSWIGFHDRPFDWGQLFTKPWFTAGIVVILLGMAVGTFGAFTVAVPTRLYSISPRHDTYWGNFLFGILTALLSTPCTFGIFVGVLAWAILQPPAVGVLILVTVGAGMASPYLVLSALPEVARRFPRTGPWAELVKQMMGFLLLLAAVYFARPFLSRVLHDETFWWAPFAVVVIAAIYLTARSFEFARTGVGRIVGTAIALLLVAGSLKAVLKLTERPFVWQPYSTAALDQARKTGRIALVEFTADWCGNCQFVEANVLHSKPVIASVRDHDILMLKADVTRDDAPARPLLEVLNPAGSIPLTVIYAPGGDGPIELTGIYSKEDLQRAIELAARVKPTSVAGS